MEINRIESFNLTSKVGKNLGTSENSEKSEKKNDESILKVKQKVDSKELTLAVDKANKVLFKNNSHLQFRIHDKTNEVMVKIIDDETGDVLKEIPTEKMLDMVAKLWEIAGILVDEKA